jgi:hypothetical protein
MMRRRRRFQGQVQAAGCSRTIRPRRGAGGFSQRKCFLLCRNVQYRGGGESASMWPLLRNKNLSFFFHARVPELGAEVPCTHPRASFSPGTAWKHCCDCAHTCGRVRVRGSSFVCRPCERPSQLAAAEARGASLGVDAFGGSLRWRRWG